MRALHRQRQQKVVAPSPGNLSGAGGGRYHTVQAVTCLSVCVQSSSRVMLRTHGGVMRMSNSANFVDVFRAQVPHSPARLRSKREQIERFSGLEPERQGQNLALTVLYVSYSLPCACPSLKPAEGLQFGVWWLVFGWGAGSCLFDGDVEPRGYFQRARLCWSACP